MRVFVSADFSGYWPVGAAAVVIAESVEQATELLSRELTDRALKFDGTLQEINTTKPHAFVLLDGEY